MFPFGSFDDNIDTLNLPPNSIVPVTTATSTWEWLLQGYSVAEIATRLEVELEELFRTVSDLVDAVVVETERLRDCWFTIGLAQLKRVQAAAWVAWTRSWQSRSRKTHKKIRDSRGEREEDVTVIEEGKGDPRYLAMFQRCIQEIAKWSEKYQSKPGKPAKVQEDPRDALNQLIQVAMQRKAAAGK